MNDVRKIHRLICLLTLTLWFALFYGAAFASEQAAPATGGDHAVVADAHASDAPAEAAHGGAHGSNSLSKAKLKDLGWRIVNFIALMIILVKFAAKPIGSGLAARQKKIKDEIETLEMQRAKAEEQYNEFQRKLATVEADIDKIVEQAIAQASVEKTKLIEKAEQAADDLKKSAERAIQNEIIEARRILKNEVADQAAIMAEEIIKKNLTAKDQVAIIDNYLAKVGAVQ
jgi:F-type H+-transporting ATPase subunit b